LLALLLALVSTLPILWIVLTSFKTFVETQVTPPVLWPGLDYVDNYTTQFSHEGGSLGSALGPLERSLIIATLTTTIVLAVAIPAGYALSHYRIMRKGDIQFWIISTRMMPLIAAIVPLSVILRRLGLTDTIPGLIIVYVAINLSFAVWLLAIFFLNVPAEVEQAAQIDGHSRLGVLWYVAIPLARAGIVVVAIFTWIFSWNELLNALVLTTSATETLPVFLSKFYSQNTLISYQEMAAVAVVQIVPAVVVTFLAQRYLVAGLSMGALSAE
jgi:ABC-type glycerol-3-phosphate transport system permease component